MASQPAAAAVLPGGQKVQDHIVLKERLLGQGALHSP